MTRAELVDGAPYWIKVGGKRLEVVECSVGHGWSGTEVWFFMFGIDHDWYNLDKDDIEVICRIEEPET